MLFLSSPEFTGDFLLLQYSSDVVCQPRDLQMSQRLFMLRLHLCFNMGFICDLSVARNESLMSYKTSTRTELMYVFITIETEGEDGDPAKIA